MAVRSSQRPPDVVIATLKALAALDYPAYEVIVIDNNTLDPKLWVPVAVCCKSLGSHFKFFHDESVIGAKAGALNLAMHRMDGRTSYLAVVDADYRVKNNFLTIAVHHLERNDIAFVQFPQAYRNAAVCARGVELELRDYFQTFARQANRARAMLLTGTLSVIRVNDLAHVGGWSAQTITEDAELGVRFFQAGRQGLFIDQVVGEGLLPLDFPSLENQRRRWVTGNLQCLFRLKASITAASASWRGLGSIAVQLSAWLTWWSIPTVVLLIDATTRAAAVFYPAAAVADDAARTLTVNLAAATIVCSLVATSARLIVSALLHGECLRDAFSAVLAKHALVWTSSRSCIETPVGFAPGFLRTPKDARQVSSRRFPNAAYGCLGLAMVVVFSAYGNILPAAAALAMCTTAPAAAWVQRSLSAYAAVLEPVRHV